MLYRFSSFTLDSTNYCLSNSERQLAIEPQVFDLLHYLVVNHGKVISRNELLDNVWAGRIVSDTTLSGHIKSVRKVLGDSGQQQSIIKTVHGRGYQFIQPVALEGDQTTAINVEPQIADNDTNGPLVAVLPFLNRSNDAEQQYFAEGVSEDIITELARFSDIQVVSRYSSFQLDSQAPTLDSFCAQQKVTYWVEGSVRKSENSVRVSVKLVDVSTRNTLWAEKYDKPLNDIFLIQDEIVETIVSTLSGQIQKVEMARANSRATCNLRAYDHLLRGLALHKNGYACQQSFNKASAEFRKAIALDPNFARARAWLICSSSNMWELMTEERINDALTQAKHALSLDSSESEIHRILGAIYLWARDFEQGNYHYQEARRLSPNDAHLAVKMGRFLAFTNRLDDALKLVRHAMLLNPLHPGWYWQELGVVYYSMGDYSQAITIFYRNWELGAYDLAFIAACHVANGDIEEANKVCRQALEEEPNASVKLFTQFENYQDESKSQQLIERMLAAGFPA
jgi:TolB-like protein/Flp pilus assembly protein TadD